MKIVTLVEDTAGNNQCQFEHGLSFYIETTKHKLLMDTGATDMSLQNARLLDIDLSQVDICILSHGHYDHSGGILPFTHINPSAKIYLKNSAGKDYYNLTDNKEKYIGINKEILKLPQCIFIKEDTKIDEELFLFSGITGTKYPAKGNLKLKKKVDDTFLQDTFDHEQCLVITQGKQRILLSGCAHNGILNILDKYLELFHSYPDIVISGFHMIQKDGYSADDIANIKNTAYALLETNATFYTGHCTGQTAYNIMKEIMHDKLQPIHSGEQI